jgi:DNA-directed RNA polymerase subunit L
MYPGFINAIERIMIQRIPTYGFARELINVERINPESGYHDSIPFNHDMMTLRLSRMPVIGIDPGIAILHERYWKNTDYLDKDRETHEEEKRVEINIDVKNTATEGDIDSILHITTNDIECYVDNEKVNIFNKHHPILVISLKPKEALKCSMKAVLGMGLRDSLWGAASNSWHDFFAVKGSMVMNVEAKSFNEFILVERALVYFKTRTKTMRDVIEKLYLLQEDQTSVFLIELIGEDSTMGEPITYELQSHPDIRSAACQIPDHLINTIVLHVTTFKADKMLTSILESMDNLYNKIEYFEKQFAKIDRPDVLFDPFGEDTRVIPYGEIAGQSTKSNENYDKKNKVIKKTKSAKKTSQ